MSRDRTARTRIRQHLASHGPVEDLSGHATGALKDAIDYQGSPVAFIQLIAAMDRSGEIKREIKGKRTYRITGLGVLAAQAPNAAGPAVQGARRPQDGVEIDYDRLAKAVVRELIGHLSRAPVVAEPVLAGARDDDTRDYARRLETARRELDDLLDEAASRATRPVLSQA